MENSGSKPESGLSPLHGSASSEIEPLIRKIEQQETLILRMAEKAGWSLCADGGFEKRTEDGRVQEWTPAHGYNHGDGPFPQPDPETTDPELYPWKLVYLPFSSFEEAVRFEQNEKGEQ